MPTIAYKLDSGGSHPVYATLGAAGADVAARLDVPLEIGPMERVLVPTGLRLEVPKGFEVQVRPRSGLAYSAGVTVLNAPGTIDSDYRGEVKVLLVNLSNTRVSIVPGQRIAQLVVARVERARFVPTVVLSDTARGEGGFGSTGQDGDV